MSIDDTHEEFKHVTGGDEFNNTNAEIMDRNLCNLSTQLKDVMEWMQTPELFTLMAKAITLVMNICETEHLPRDSDSTLACVCSVLDALGRDVKMKNMMESKGEVSLLVNHDLRTIIAKVAPQMNDEIERFKFKRRALELEQEQKSFRNNGNNGRNNDDTRSKDDTRNRNNRRGRDQGDNSNNNNNNNNNGGPSKKYKKSDDALAEIIDRCLNAEPSVKMVSDGKKLLNDDHNLKNACLWCVLHNLVGSKHNQGSAKRLHQSFEVVTRNPKNLNNIDKFIAAIHELKEDE